MQQSDPAPFFVTPAAGLLSRCVARGALSQEEIDSASSATGSAFSSRVQQAEERIKAKRELDQLKHQMDLLKLDKLLADVTHPFYLSARFQSVQCFCSHLQDIVKNQTQLRLRLLRPLDRTHLTVHADLHRFVVEVVKLLKDFVKTLDEKVATVRKSPENSERLEQLNLALSQLLLLVAEVSTLSEQTETWKDVRNSVLSDSSG